MIIVVIFVTMRIFYKPYIETKNERKTRKEILPFKRKKPYVSLLYQAGELVTQQEALELKAWPPMIKKPRVKQRSESRAVYCNDRQSH